MFGKWMFGVFHSKLMLLEFDDRLRVVISSANLYRFDWDLMSQVIWFQDFFKKDPETPEDSTFKRKRPSCEFEDYLKEFVYRMRPKGNYKG